MMELRDYAETAAAALAGKLRVSLGEVDRAGAADIIEQVLGTAAQEQEEAARERIDEEQAAARGRLTQLLSASPAVIYSFKASGDYVPTFVSENIETLFGYAPREYLDNPNFWRERVHPDDLQRVETEVSDLLKNGKHALEYRFRKSDGTYCWVNDEQHVIRDEKGDLVEVVGSWSDITARKLAEEAESEAHTRLSTLLKSAPAVIYSFKATGDFAPIFVSDNIKLFSATARTNISRMPTSGASASIPTIFGAWRPSKPSCSRRAGTLRNIASAKATAPIAG